MSWFKRIKRPLISVKERKLWIPEGLWVKCSNCKEIVYKKEMERNLKVCPKCDYHNRIRAREWITLLTDEGSFVEHDSDLKPTDPLKFKDSVRYTERIRSSIKRTGMNEAVIWGEGAINGTLAQVAVFEFDYMGGSMGSVAGEKVARMAESAVETQRPAVIVSCSGGARMQEGVLSLMQMAKTSSALARLSMEGLPYISILTNPTTGGVSASFAMLGDVIMAEPGALIGFAGPRVIEQTIKRSLPEGFQRSEFLLEHGMIDMVVRRRDMKDTVSRILKLLRQEKGAREAIR